MSGKLDEARKIINEVDKQMAELFVKRMKAAEMVYEHKKEFGLPILDVAREDMVDTIMNCLEDKFHTIRNGKGISFAVPLSSVIGVNLYRFLSDNRMGREA